LINAARWPQNNLKWIYLNTTHYQANQTGLVNQTVMRHTIHRALYEWGQHTPLTFTEVSVISDADIKISFQAGNHSDPYPFDGHEGTIAHAFYPPDGRVHLDFAETDWSDEEKLFRVLVHEFGHMLGLGHNPNTTLVDIMYPIYLDFLNGIGPDDIAGIQFLYGPKPNVTTTTSTTTTTTTTTTSTTTTPYPKRRIKPIFIPRVQPHKPRWPPRTTPRTTSVRPTITTPTPHTRSMLPTTSRPKKHQRTQHERRRRPKLPFPKYHLKHNHIININSTSPIIFILNEGTIRLH